MERTGFAPLLKEAGVCYSLFAALNVLVSLVVLLAVRAALGEGYATNNLYLYLGYLVVQVCMAASAAVFFRRSKLPPRAVYSRCKSRYLLLAPVLAFGLFSFSELNGFFLQLLGKMGYTAPVSPFPELSGWYLLPAILIIALLPAFFEETVFRGVLVRSMRESGWGDAATVLLSGTLFMLYHGNPAQTLYQFICGACYGLLAVRSGSVFPSMIAHFSNNAVILALMAAGMEEIPSPAKLPLYLTAGVCLAGVLVYLLFFDRRDVRKGGAKGGAVFFAAAAVGIVVCGVQWLTLLAEGFLA